MRYGTRVTLLPIARYLQNNLARRQDKRHSAQSQWRPLRESPAAQDALSPPRLTPGSPKAWAELTRRSPNPSKRWFRATLGFIMRVVSRTEPRGGMLKGIVAGIVFALAVQSL